MLTPWVTRLIFANAGVFLLQQLFNPTVTLLLGLLPAAVLVRPWTPVTYMFLHGDLWHLLFNMLGLFFFGPRIEARLGSRRFLLLYFASGIAGAALSVLTPRALIIGASGAVFGVFFAFARYYPRERIYIWGILPVEARVLVVAVTALSLWAGFTGGSGGIAHFAHLGGFLGGYLYLKFTEVQAAAVRARFRPTPPPTRSTGADDLQRWRRIRRDDLHPLNRDELDRVLEKISAGGMESLTPEERTFLNRFSKQL
ncbi:MAG: rhomboid family intramembrane serine protease [Gemmatimonadota bacterium]|nr:rhomboid family intramembrane serine protease [Gemmatimonadota bacterium]